MKVSKIKARSSENSSTNFSASLLMGNPLRNFDL
jgi:hypothetical protein